MDDFIQKVTRSVEEAKEKIESIRGSDSLVFPIFADLHTEDADHEFMKKLIPTLKLITEKIEYDAVINLGDNFDMLGRTIHITNDELKNRYERIFSSIYNAAKHPVINVNGNHDGLGTEFFKPDFWNSLVKGKYDNTSACYGDDGCYHYIDYEKANTRLVVLSLPYDSDIESEMPTPIWSFGTNQLKWLKDTALNTDKAVIILSHVPFYYKYTGDTEAKIGVWTGKEAKETYIASICASPDDADEAVAIIDEFAAGPDTRLVACLSGHIHYDSFWLPHEEKDGKKNPLPCHQVVTTSACIAMNFKPEMGICIDVAVWTPSKGEFNIIRIGDGDDRKI